MAECSPPKPSARSAAVVSFMPDYGHWQPLLKIADALLADGFSIRCYAPSECAPLLRRLPVDVTFLEPMDLAGAKAAMAEAFRRSIFFNRYSAYSASNVYQFPAIMAAAAASASRIEEALRAQRPDVVVADEKLFVDWYGRMAAAVGAPLVVNSNDGSLAYARRPYENAYGVTGVPPAVQTAVELAGSVFSQVYRVGYRFGRVADARRALAVKRAAKQAFDAVFPTPADPTKVIGPISVGSAKIERERLGDAADASRPVFDPIRFRDAVPIPDDLRNWLDAPSGRPVVYVSFGSMVELTERFAAAVHAGLARTEARVLWRIPPDQRRLLASLPSAKNIRVETFVPQPEVLAHPAVRCFVTQGGSWSVQEGFLAGTPMVVIPFFADQPYNASIVERLGLGRRLWRSRTTPEAVAAAVREILMDGRHRASAEALADHLRGHDGARDVAAFVHSVLRRTDPAPVRVAQE